MRDRTLIPVIQLRCNLDAATVVSAVFGFGLDGWAEQCAELIGNEELSVRLWVVVALWSFLATPGVVTVRNELTREGRKARKRGRFSLSAVHSYNRVELNLPREAVWRRGNVQFARGPGVRRHDVIGHIRRRTPESGQDHGRPGCCVKSYGPRSHAALKSAIACSRLAA